MVLFVLHKLILQTRMRRHPVALDVWFSVRPFVYFHTLSVQTMKALARLCGCTGLPEPSSGRYVISTIIPWAGSVLIFWRWLGIFLGPSLCCFQQKAGILFSPWQIVPVGKLNLIIKSLVYLLQNKWTLNVKTIHAFVEFQIEFSFFHLPQYYSFRALSSKVSSCTWLGTVTFIFGLSSIILQIVSSALLLPDQERLATCQKVCWKWKKIRLKNTDPHPPPSPPSPHQ